MTRHLVLPLVALLLLVASPLQAADDPAPEADLKELSKMLQKLVVPKVPKEHEENKNWGQTIPLQPNLRLPRLRRTVKVGDREELPHGVWQRSKIWIDDPEKDVQVQATALRRLDDKKLRLTTETEVKLHGERERRRWEKGLPLFALTVQADVTAVVTLDCDVEVTLQRGLPPKVTVDARVAECKLAIKEFELRRVGPVIEADAFKELGEELKAVLEMELKAHETDLKRLANEALARALKDGNGGLSASDLLKLASKPRP